MKIADWRAKSDAELEDEYVRKREEIARLTFQKAVEQMEDASVLRKAKRDVARILTVLREREIDVQRKAQEQPVEE